LILKQVFESLQVQCVGLSVFGQRRIVPLKICDFSVIDQMN